MDRATFAISHRAGDNEDALPVHIVGARQELGRVPPTRRPRLAPHSLVQEFLNRTERLWGLVTNGSTLRRLRDNSIRRQAYVEFDLQQILEEQRFHDFAVLYRLPPHAPATIRRRCSPALACKVLRTLAGAGWARARTPARRSRTVRDAPRQRLPRPPGQFRTATASTKWRMANGTEGGERPLQKSKGE